MGRCTVCRPKKQRLNSVVELQTRHMAGVRVGGKWGACGLLALWMKMREKKRSKYKKNIVYGLELCKIRSHPARDLIHFAFSLFSYKLNHANPISLSASFALVAA